MPFVIRVRTRSAMKRVTSLSGSSLLSELIEALAPLLPDDEGSGPPLDGIVITLMGECASSLATSGTGGAAVVYDSSLDPELPCFAKSASLEEIGIEHGHVIAVDRVLVFLAEEQEPANEPPEPPTEPSPPRQPAVAATNGAAVTECVVGFTDFNDEDDELTRAIRASMNLSTDVGPAVSHSGSSDEAMARALQASMNDTNSPSGVREGDVRRTEQLVQPVFSPTASLISSLQGIDSLLSERLRTSPY